MTDPTAAALQRLRKELGIPIEALATFDRGKGGHPRHLGTPEACRVRDQVAWLLRHDRRWTPVQPSYPEIARAMGWRSHSAALEAVRRHQGRLDGKLVPDDHGTPHAGV